MITQVGVGGIFTVLVLQQVFRFLSIRKNGRNGDMKRLLDMMEDLYKWHDQRDSDGVPIWYVRKSLESAVDKLGASIDRQTELLQGLIDVVKDMRRNTHVKT